MASLTTKQISEREVTLERLKALKSFIGEGRHTNTKEMVGLTGFTTNHLAILAKNNIIIRKGSKLKGFSYNWGKIIPNRFMAEKLNNEMTKQNIENHRKTRDKSKLQKVEKLPTTSAESKWSDIPSTILTGKADTITKPRILKFSPHMLAPNIIDMLNDIEVIQCNSVDGKNFQLTIKGHL